ILISANFDLAVIINYIVTSLIARDSGHPDGDRHAQTAQPARDGRSQGLAHGGPGPRAQDHREQAAVVAQLAAGAAAAERRSAPDLLRPSGVQVVGVLRRLGLPPGYLPLIFFICYFYFILFGSVIPIPIHI